MPTGKIIAEYSDFYGFAAKAMNAQWILQKPVVSNSSSSSVLMPANVAG
jgi:hypothetical protein